MMANLQCYHSNVPTTSTCRLGTKIIQIFFWTPFNVLFKRNKDVNPTRNVCMDQFTVSSLDRLHLLYTWRCACVCMGRGTGCVVYDSLLTCDLQAWWTPSGYIQPSSKCTSCQPRQTRTYHILTRTRPGYF